MKKNLAIGVILILGAAILLISTNSNAKGAVDDYLGKIDKRISCDIGFDYNSVHSSTCSIVDTCRTGFFSTQFLGAGEETSTLRILYGGRTYGSEKITTTFGFNEKVSMSACVPGAANAVDIQVLRETGEIADTRSAVLS